jgi:hypothetical protein
MVIAACWLAGCDTADAPASTDWPLVCENSSFELAEPLTAGCARRDEGGRLILQPGVLAAIEPGSPVQTLRVEDQWLFVLHGKFVPALTYDNGPDYFQEGLARTFENNRVGFVNETLEPVVGPVWDFAFPFENGVAVVCTGCRRVADGEHTSIEGGGWGYIDPTGAVVVEPVHSRDSLPSPPRRSRAGSEIQ